jgi:hypothetical protein
MEIAVKKFKFIVFFVITILIVYVSLNFYESDRESNIDLEMRCPKILSYEKDLVLNINVTTKNEYLEAVELGLQQENILLDYLKIQRSTYKLEKNFNKNIAFRISENKVEKDKKLTVSTFARDKYGFESYKHCIYESFELINNPNE